MTKIIIEVGSTVTKVDKYQNEDIIRIEEKPILFKNNYSKEGKIKENDFQTLIRLVNKYRNEYQDILVCGTSFFRNLTNLERETFLSDFKQATEIDFQIISQNDEALFTVKRAVKNTKGKVCLFIGGGGSTEIAMVDKNLLEVNTTNIGVMDVLKKFPNLKDGISRISLQKAMEYIKEHLNLPKEKSDILVLAGGNHLKFVNKAKFRYNDNKLYQDDLAPILMDIETRIMDTEKYFKEITIEEINAKPENPSWWDSTRVMCAFVLVVAKEIGAKYIIPTNIGMTYGLINRD